MATLLSSIVFHGVASAMVLYLAAMGLGITLGLMGVANLAHGAFAMFGGYAALVLMQRAGLPFWLAVPGGALLVAAASLPIERLLYARLYRAPELDQVLLTVGLVFIATAAAAFLFGPTIQRLPPPAALSGLVDLGLGRFPAYRAFLILVGIASYLGLRLAVDHTLFGARLRAAVDNPHMAEGVGIRTDRLFSLAFALGAGLAALGGALGSEVIPLRPTYAVEILPYVLVVVAVGGLGSVDGPFLAALLLGIVDTAVKYLLPGVGAFVLYALMLAILLRWPRGLVPRRA